MTGFFKELLRYFHLLFYCRLLDQQTGLCSLVAGLLSLQSFTQTRIWNCPHRNHFQKKNQMWIECEVFCLKKKTRLEKDKSLLTVFSPFLITFSKPSFSESVKLGMDHKMFLNWWHYLPLEGMLTLPKRQILDSSKLKEFADDNFKFDERDRKLLKRVENTVWKGEIARYEQFLLFPQCFQKTCTADT